MASTSEFTINGDRHVVGLRHRHFTVEIVAAWEPRDETGRPRRPVVRLDLRGLPQAMPHMIGDGLRDLLPRAEPRHLLEALQVNQQRQQRPRGLGPLPRPRDLILRRGEEHVQHAR